MKHLYVVTTCLLASAIAMAFASPPQAQAQAPAHSSTVQSAAFELAREEQTSTATVTNIDRGSRFVTLRGANGNEFTIEAGPEVRNFDQLKVGDEVTATFEAATALELLPADSAAIGVETSGETDRAPKGSKPGASAEQAISVTSRLTALDLKNHTVTLTGPDGKQREIKVKDPARQARMKQLRVGQMVRVTYVEAIAVMVTPKPAR